MQIGRFCWSRVRYFGLQWPNYLQRTIRHFRQWTKPYRSLPYAPDLSGVERFAHWWTELVFLLLDLLGISCLYDCWMSLVKYRSRGLTVEEIQMGKRIFGEAIAWDLVRIDDRAYIGCRRYRYAYVSFFTINSWGALRADILIHELVHVLQYQQMGAIYIVRAVYAQRTSMGYDYGGEDRLLMQKAFGAGVWDFNLEQQADIVTDYFRLKHGLAPQWGRADVSSLPLYYWYVGQLVKRSARFGGTRF